MLRYPQVFHGLLTLLEGCVRCGFDNSATRVEHRAHGGTEWECRGMQELPILYFSAVKLRDSVRNEFGK